MLKSNSVAILLLIAAVVLADDAGKPSNPIIPPQPSNDTTPSPPSTTVLPSTTEKTTTSEKPTTSTQPPTPSTKPTEPPTKPTTSTTPKPTTPTTPKPTTPTTHSPPTSPAPAPTTPKPAPSSNTSWVVSEPNGTVCIVGQMVIKIDVQYKSIENKTVHAPFNVMSVQNATANGTCGIANQTLVLTWNNVTATFLFDRNSTNTTYSLKSINIVIPVNNVTFPNNTMSANNITAVNLEYSHEIFSIPVNHSYTCSKVNPLSIAGHAWNSSGPIINSTVNGNLELSKVHVQAFGTSSSEKFYAPMDCVSTETPDIVPIAVGLVLAGLVIVVLIAYLVGRRRAQSRGYLSM